MAKKEQEKSPAKKDAAKAAAPKAEKVAAAPKAEKAAVPKDNHSGEHIRVPRYQALYENEIRKKMQERFGYKNSMEVPRLEKIVINMGVGEAVADSKQAQQAAEELGLITGQKPVVTKAKKAEAAFKIRAGLPIGCKVTLRKQRMYEFMDRFVTIAMPRIRDFRGVSPKGFDGKGNYNMGLKEQIIFAEINYDRVSQVRGMDIAFVTTAKTDEEARALLEAFNFPFRKTA